MIWYDVGFDKDLHNVLLPITTYISHQKKKKKIYHIYKFLKSYLKKKKNIIF